MSPAMKGACGVRRLTVTRATYPTRVLVLLRVLLSLSFAVPGRAALFSGVLAFFLGAVPSVWAGVTVSLVAPTNGSTVNSPLTLTASASATQGYTLSKVEFFNGSTLVGTDTAFPYTIIWGNVAPGNYTLTAKATAIKQGAPDQTATSSPVNVTVNAVPTVSFTSPTDGAIYSAPATVTLTAAASDSDGTITKVEFFEWYWDSNEGFLIATLTAPPYSHVISGLGPPPSGHGSSTFTYKAVATDNRAAGAEAWVSVTVERGVALTSPSNGAFYTAPATISLSASVTPDTNIQRVEFYRGTTLIGISNNSPYTYSWQNVSAGTYSLTAKAIDVSENSWTSPIVNVTVGAPPSSLYFIHPDHLNTPRLVANQSGQTVWRWDQNEPFGLNVPDENPSGLGIFDLPLRLPGHYFDKETNLHYNYYRDYDPNLGRYGESDPIGIYGGINTYAYVGASPLRYVDKNGLQFMGAEPPPGIGGPWKWFSDSQNDRGGVWRNPAGKNANWDPSGHWDVWDKNGRQRYDRWGNPTDLHRNPARKASDKPIVKWGKKACKVLGPLGTVGTIGLSLALDEPINVGDLLCDAVWGCGELQ